ncbi:MAG: alanine--tRNA ligase [Anaerolineae bacterium]|nr:alanine--tRNA ligase [Anaerolineae bacterium]
MKKQLTGAEIRQSFIDYFVQKQGHTFVPSASLVPGGDQTLLFTNAGMVQFKEVFLGTDVRPYNRAVNSQRCMRVAGKHNDLDDVGRDNTHHTFFEMLGNWSFGDYYKKEAISWAWELLTEVWGLDKNLLWATCFKDEKGQVASDEEAATYWRQQPGMLPEHVMYCGRKENFWEMADTGPCGPCSEIHIDQGESFCDKKDVPGHVCRVNGDCKRFMELWNLVFMQYNRLGPDELVPLPATHVDTGMGLERIVSVIQGVYSNYKTDLLLPLMEEVRAMTGQSIEEREANLTPYRVIADHSRSAAFLIADGVVPGNTGRNYICRMIIRRAAQFGTKLGLFEPFLAKVADKVIENYGDFYPELKKNRTAVLDSITREEKRFRRTVEAGLSYLNELLDGLKQNGQTVLDGHQAFDLYATHGLPLEITRDIAREQDLDVDEAGFRQAMEEHRLASGAGKAFGPLGGEDVDVYRAVLEQLTSSGKLSTSGVAYDPYHNFEVEEPILALVREGEPVNEVEEGDLVEVILARTGFYVESGGQVSDQGSIVSVNEPRWEITIEEMRKPAAGIITHVGRVVRGTPKVGDVALAAINSQRRRDIMRNHTATHILHAELHSILGGHARQAGSLVAPDHFRFDFTHPDGLTADQLEKIEAGVNRAILADFPLNIVTKSLAQATAEGAMALFGEKYGEQVRTVTIGQEEPYSYELCGGTHVHETGDIGLFLIVSESSAAAGVRRIEAVTGRAAYELVQRRFKTLKQTAAVLTASVDEAPDKASAVLAELDDTRKQVNTLRQQLVAESFNRSLENVPEVNGIPVLAAVLPNANVETMRQMTDRFRERYASGVVVLGCVVDDKPSLIAAVTDDLVKRGIMAGELVKEAAAVMGGSGGGRPNMAQAGGKDAAKLGEAIDKVLPFVKKKLGA